MSRTLKTAFLALALTAGLPAESRTALIVNTPAGISPGQSFIVVVVDSSGGNAESTSITTYNAAVAAAAAGITYPAGTIGPWVILGATATSGTPSLFSSPLPVYDDQGTLLSSSGTDYPIGTSPLFDQNGTTFFDAFVFTGLDPSGAPAPLDELGGLSSDTAIGSSGGINPGGYSFSALPSSDSEFYYGYATFTASSVTPIPEPSTLMVAGLALGVVGCGAWMRRRRVAAVGG